MRAISWHGAQRPGHATLQRHTTQTPLIAPALVLATKPPPLHPLPGPVEVQQQFIPLRSTRSVSLGWFSIWMVGQLAAISEMEEECRCSIWKQTCVWLLANESCSPWHVMLHNRWCTSCYWMWLLDCVHWGHSLTNKVMVYEPPPAREVLETGFSGDIWAPPPFFEPTIAKPFDLIHSKRPLWIP